MTQEEKELLLRAITPPIRECSLCHALVPMKEIKDGLCEVCRLFLDREKEE